MKCKKELNSIRDLIPRNVLPLPIVLASKIATKTKDQNRYIKTATDNFMAQPLFKKNSSI